MQQTRNNLTKHNIAETITKKIGLSVSYNKEVVNDLVNLIVKNLNKINILKVTNFGTFHLKKKNKRIGRNPKNNKTHEISERNLISFNCSEEFKKKINSSAR